MERLINEYLKTNDPEVLHKLRIEARRLLSLLETEGKTDIGLKELLKKSSKVRDIDVLLKICKKKKVKKYLIKKREKLNKKLILFLKNFYSKIIEIQKKEISLNNCIKVICTSFLNKNDKKLHKIRLKIKKCRYTQKQYEKEFKKIQDILGKIHDYYNCYKLMKKLGFKAKKIKKKKKKLIKKAEKIRLEVLKAVDESGICIKT